MPGNRHRRAGNSEVFEDDVTGFVAEAATRRHLHAAMERAWASRDRWEEIGVAAASAIRKLIPGNPARVFASRLLELIAVAAAPKWCVMT
jgi:hypothetical protein